MPDRLNGTNYLQFLRDVLPGLIQILDLPVEVEQNIIFQHDGCPAHFQVQVRQYLDQQYAGRWFGRGGPVEWPPRSPDMNVCDYFLWGFVKDFVYRRDPQNREIVLGLIHQAFQAITPEMIRSATRNIIPRIIYCIENDGGHFEQFLH